MSRVKLFVGNPCGGIHCKDPTCENCTAWSPCIYYGEGYKEIKLPKWKWLVNLLYRIEVWLIER